MAVDAFSARDFRAPIALFLLSFVLLSMGARYHAALDTVPAQLLPVSILREGDLDFNEFGSSLHTNRYWYQNVEGALLSSYSIVPGLLNVPVFAAAETWGVDILRFNKKLSLLTALWLTALTISFHGLIARCAGASPWSAGVLALLFGFSTTYWSVNARGLWEHTPAVLFISGALVSLMRARFAAAGLLLGLAVCSRPVLIVFTLVVTLYVVLHHRKHFALFALGALLPAMLFLSYYHFYFSDIFAPFFSNARSISRFGFPSLDAALGLLISPSRGLFVFSPVLLLAIFPGALQSLRGLDTPPLYRWLFAGFLAHLALLSCWSIWWGGHSFGPRLLTDMLPVLFVFLVLAFRHLRSAGARLLAAVLVGSSVSAHFLGATFMPCGANHALNINQHPERLWDIRGSELLRCAARARGRFF